MTKTLSDSHQIGRRDLLAVLGLFVAVVVLYARTATFDFVDFDDNIYVFDNDVVRQGLTLDGVRWAFTTGLTGNWHPLTWLSHMLDVTLFGVTPGAHHLTNVLLHAINGALLFIALRVATGAFWPSVVAAALFALHPLRVESVAWIAERKDVLSTLFWLLTMLAYVRYVQTRRLVWYVLSLLTLTLGLLSKSMLVTLPFALLLLDLWPLGRRQDGSGRATLQRLLLEKLPMLALCGIMAYITLRVQAAGGAVTALQVLSPEQRFFNAVASYFDYLWFSFAPVGLAIFYPNPYFDGGVGIAAWKLALAFATLLVLSLAAIFSVRRRPYLFVGWFWFLGTLVPVIGIVQVGSQARADRYTYVPSIGLSIAVVWVAAELLRRWPRQAAALGGVAAVALSVITLRQIGYWRDSETVMRRAADVVPDNWLAHTNLGTIYDARGDLDRAERAYRESLRIVPDDPISNNNLGGLLVTTGRAGEALPLLEKAVSLQPDYIAAHVALGDAHDQLNDWPRAVAAFERALTLSPSDKDANHHFALALARRGNLMDAIARWDVALRADPDFVAALDGSGRALLLTGNIAEGRSRLRRVIERQHDAHAAMYVLAWSLATAVEVTTDDADEAVRVSQRALEHVPNNLAYVDAHAAALAAAGKFEAAANLAEQVEAALRKAGDSRTADAIAARRSLYQSGQRFTASVPTR